jgi:hypothetical protein
VSQGCLNFGHASFEREGANAADLQLAAVAMRRQRLRVQAVDGHYNNAVNWQRKARGVNVRCGNSVAFGHVRRYLSAADFACDRMHAAGCLSLLFMR